MARRSGMEDFLRNFNAGLSLGKNVSQGLETRRVMNAGVEAGSEYTSEDARQLEAIGNAKDTDGNSFYQINANQDGSYGLSMRGQDGGYAPVDGVQFKPQQYTSFLGQRHQGNLTSDQIDGLRANALANVQMKYDPEKGLQMRRQLKQDAREDARFAREEKANKRADAVQLSLDEAYKLDNPALVERATNMGRMMQEHGIPILYQGQTDQGFSFVGLDPKTGEPGQQFYLNPLAMRQVAGAASLFAQGFGTEAMQQLQGADEHMFKLVNAYNATLDKTTTSRTNALANDEKVRHNRVSEGQAWARINDGRAARAERAAQQKVSGLQYVQDERGNTFMVGTVMGKDGPEMWSKEVPVEQARLLSRAQGQKPEKPFDPKAYIEYVGKAMEANGGNEARARMEADQMFGRAQVPSAAEFDAAAYGKKGERKPENRGLNLTGASGAASATNATKTDRLAPVGGVRMQGDDERVARARAEAQRSQQVAAEAARAERSQAVQTTMQALEQGIRSARSPQQAQAYAQAREALRRQAQAN